MTHWLLLNDVLSESWTGWKVIMWAHIPFKLSIKFQIKTTAPDGGKCKCTCDTSRKSRKHMQPLISRITKNSSRLSTITFSSKFMKGRSNAVLKKYQVKVRLRCSATTFRHGDLFIFFTSSFLHISKLRFPQAYKCQRRQLNEVIEETNGFNAVK